MSKTLCLLLTLLLCCGCGRRRQEAPPAAAVEAAAPAIVKPALLAEAARLGLAGRVPQDAAFCVSSAGLSRHAQALKATRWWQRTAAFVEERLPAGESLPVDDFCLVFGPESTPALLVLRQLSDLYNETAYRGMMSGGALAGLGLDFDLGRMIEAALADAQVLDALILLLERLEMPPVMLGFATPEPETVLRRASDMLRLSAWLGDAPQSRIITTQGEQITVNEIAMEAVLTPELRRAWLESLKGVADEQKDRLARALEVLAGKKWVLALGLGKERAFVAVGRAKEQVRLAISVEESMLARPELRFADEPRILRDPGLIACWDGAFLNALQSDEPFQPMVRGLLAGLAREPQFAPLAARLLPLVAELAAAERAWSRGQFSDGAAVAWWEGGLRAEWAGGMSAERLAALAAGSRFTHLLNDEAVVLGVSGPGSTDSAGRAYFEAWMRTAHAAASGLVEAGVGGENAAMALKALEAALLPDVLLFYDGTKTLWQKALGPDGALVLDVGGQMPPLPGLPPGGSEVPLPRLTLAQDLRNRALVGVAWEGMESALGRLLRQLPAPQPLELPQVVTSTHGALTSHAYAMPFESEDLVPCASLTENLLVLGTSRAQQRLVAESLAGARVDQPGILRVKAGFPRLREFLSTYAAVRAQNEDVSALRSMIQWLEPLGTLDLRLWQEPGTGRGQLTWQLRDVRAYD